MSDAPDDLQRKMAELEALRPSLGDTAVDAALAALKAQAAAPPAPPPPNVQGQAQVGGDNSGQVIGVIQDSTVNQTNNITNPPPPDPAIQRQQQALRDYLRMVRSAYQTLQLGQLDETEAGARESLRLDHVYVRLHTQSQVAMSKQEIAEQEARDPMFRVRRSARDEQERPTRPLSVLEALSQSHPARLMLLGGPGSGKSTLVTYFSLCLVGATLCHDHSDTTQPAGGWLAAIPDWQHGQLIPLRIILRHFADSDALRAASQGSVARLHAYLREHIQQHLPTALDVVAALIDAMTAGRVMFLFDGLDEVVGEPRLTRVAETIRAVADTYTICPTLVTCRILDYQASPARQLAGFRVETLAPLSNAQIHQFVDAWYAELARTRREMKGTAASLHTLIDTRPDPRSPDPLRSPSRPSCPSWSAT